MTNKFIVFEGIEACGKSTQIKLLADWLSQKGENVWTTAEPSTSEIGKTIRYYLQHGGLDNKTMALLFAADRSLHCKEIQNHLNNGEWVLCDRYIASSLAYQDYAQYSNLSLVINKDFLKPDLTFFIKIPIEESYSRIIKRNGIKECFDNKVLLEKIDNTYNNLIDYNYFSVQPYRIDIINGVDSIENIFNTIKNDVSDSFLCK